jgi:hypothetical protein
VIRRIALLLVVAAATARADEADLGVRTIRFAERGDQLVASGTFTEVFDADLLEQLASGFAQTIVLGAYVHQASDDTPIWYTTATYRVVYAQWDEVYLVRVRDPSGEHNLREAGRAEALRDATTMRELPIAPLAQIAVGGRYYASFIVEVNPVTPELVAEVRRWLARPRGGQVGTDSFFGSFVSIFVNPKVPAADRTLRFRSQDFARGGR